MREHVVDGAKASPVVAYMGAWFSGVSINEWATFAAFLYTCLLIYDKLRTGGYLGRVTAWVRRLLHRG